MTPVQRVQVVIDKRGNLVISVSGIPGGKCHEITRPLEEDLGAVVETSPTEEARQPDVRHQTENILSR